MTRRARYQVEQRIRIDHQAPWLYAASVLLLAACSGIPQRAKEEQLQQQYLQYAGAPVDRFTYLGRFDSWSALSGTQLVVWTTLNVDRDRCQITEIRPVDYKKMRAELRKDKP